MLASIGADRIPTIQVFNKIDLLEEPARIERDEQGQVSRVFLSARTGEGLDLLRQALAERFGRRVVRLTMRLPPVAGRARAELYQRGAVQQESVAEDGTFHLSLEMAATDLEALCLREQLPLPPELSPSVASPMAGEPCVAQSPFLQSHGTVAAVPA